MIITTKQANQLSNLICEALIKESANVLPDICQNYGLKGGTITEAFNGKKNYIYSRISHFSPDEIFDLAKMLEGKYADSGLDKYLSSLDLNEEFNHISTFEDIHSVLIKNIKEAKYIIWVAVAWFTDKDLANELYLQKLNGLNIQIILNDDQINQKLANLDQHFELIKVPANHSPFDKLLHHKFCIIDFRVVIHGSYNWTTKAKYNHETISVIEDRTTGLQFADKFIEIKKEIMKTVHNRAVGQ